MLPSQYAAMVPVYYVNHIRRVSLYGDEFMKC